jgi:Na+-transporting NADH:ubiquinone oxidoreductase subunit NqrC
MFAGGAMSTTNYLLFCILLKLVLGAIIAFSYFVIKPFQTRWAIARARQILEAGQARSEWQFRNVYRMLATAHHDLEADKLWHKLDEIKESPERVDNHKFTQLIGIIPPGGKF